jgi:hypothetical protein
MRYRWGPDEIIIIRFGGALGLVGQMFEYYTSHCYNDTVSIDDTSIINMHNLILFSAKFSKSMVVK